MRRARSSIHAKTSCCWCRTAGRTSIVIRLWKWRLVHGGPTEVMPSMGMIALGAKSTSSSWLGTPRSSVYRMSMRPCATANMISARFSSKPMSNRVRPKPSRSYQ